MRSTDPALAADPGAIAAPAPPRAARRHRVLRRVAVGLLAAAAALYLLLLAALWWQQERLIFRPAPLRADHGFDLPADVHEVSIDVPGARLNALHLRLPEPSGVVYFLHGNGGNLRSWFVNVDFYRSMNVDLFMIDYRGYGKSSGRITSEAELMADVGAAWASVAPRYAGLPAVFLGRSLGSGLAAQLAAALPDDQRPRLLLLVSPYSSLLALGAQRYPFVPSALLRYPLRTDRALRALAGSATEVLLLHGERDRTIPASHSAALAMSNPAVRQHRVAGAGHSDIQDFDDYRHAVRQAVRAAVATAAAAKERP